MHRLRCKAAVPSRNCTFTRRSCSTDTRDANLPECPPLESRSRVAIDVSHAAAWGGVCRASAQECLDLSLRVDVLGYSERPRTAGFSAGVAHSEESGNPDTLGAPFRSIVRNTRWPEVIVLACATPSTRKCSPFPRPVRKRRLSRGHVSGTDTGDRSQLLPATAVASTRPSDGPSRCSAECGD